MAVSCEHSNEPLGSIKDGEFLNTWTTINPLKTEFLINNTYKFSPYLTGNTLRHRYKDQPVNVV
jgi:hypothetical protein